jgi:hypothetical protein
MDKLLEQLGYSTPLIYAAATYGLFNWLDENASDEAKAALANTMRFNQLNNGQIALALVEVFDRIYTYPLLRWHAFLRSLMFTLAVSAIFTYETYESQNLDTESGTLLIWGFSFSVNVATDFLSLFIIRRRLVSGGSRPVFSLATGTLLGFLVVSCGALFRVVLYLVDFGLVGGSEAVTHLMFEPKVLFSSTFIFALPAMAVFGWLPLLALGILAFRTMASLSWVLAKTQWFLKGGTEHPLRAVGYIAALTVFIIAAVRHALIKA